MFINAAYDIKIGILVSIRDCDNLYLIRDCEMLFRHAVTS